MLTDTIAAAVYAATEMKIKDHVDDENFATNISDVFAEASYLASSVTQFVVVAGGVAEETLVVIIIISGATTIAVTPPMANAILAIPIFLIIVRLFLVLANSFCNNGIAQNKVDHAAVRKCEYIFQRFI